MASSSFGSSISKTLCSGEDSGASFTFILSSDSGCGLTSCTSAETVARIRPAASVNTNTRTAQHSSRGIEIEEGAKGGARVSHTHEIGEYAVKSQELAMEVANEGRARVPWV